MTETIDKNFIVQYFQQLQDSICQALETLDGGGKFREDLWQRKEGGGGRSRAIQGNVIEKGGVNFSAVHGRLPEKISETLQLPRSDFFATGVSIVLHPVSPMVPIIHMNVRYFETDSEQQSTWWFGGGIDLTPHYVVEDDARFFHRQLRQVCDKHQPGFYQKFKSWADDYFFLKHRQETRGIGGIFFDHLNEKEGMDKTSAFAFVKDVGEVFAPTYARLVSKNKDLPYGDREKNWQLLRRGRYVEFNLLWDKGTKFGLDTDGRTESILMSMPPKANWDYCHVPEPGSPEEATLRLLKKGIDWVES